MARIDRGPIGAAIGISWWLFIAVLVYLLWPPKAHGEDRASVSPKIAVWSYQPVTVRLTVRHDGCDEYRVFWQDGSSSGSTDCQDSIQREHIYKSPGEYDIEVVIAHDGKVRRVRVLFILQ